MRRLLVTCSVTVSLALTSSAFAGWHEFWHRSKVDFHRNVAWPEPFQSADRAATREYFKLQVSNGWRLQNTVGVLFFDEETDELNRAGELKIKHIVTQSPVHRRTVFVLVGDSQQMTAKRVEAVQRAVSRYVPDGPLPQILLTDVDLEGGSGEYFDRIDAAYRSSTPPPRLGGAADASGASAGAAGGQ